MWHGSLRLRQTRLAFTPSRNKSLDIYWRTCYELPAWSTSESRYLAVNGNLGAQGSVLGFIGWSEHFFPESYFHVGNATAQSWFRSAYPLDVAACSSLLSFFQRSHLSGRRLKSSSAHTCGAVLFGLSEIVRPGRKRKPLVDVRHLLAISCAAAYSFSVPCCCAWWTFHFVRASCCCWPDSPLGGGLFQCRVLLDVFTEHLALQLLSVPWLSALACFVDLSFPLRACIMLL